jgi:phthiocerol/phenolphthiocerol synthesis type-I polyketide synthase E
MIGHSVGELAAACIAGVFTLEEGLEILATRGKLMDDLPGGAMPSVRLSEDAIQPCLAQVSYDRRLAL